MENKRIYLATKLFSFFDRFVSEIMYHALENVSSLKYYSIYLPFKDSNQKVSNEGNVARNIFLADITALDRTDIFITRLDGLSYDAGVGFEIGYCRAKGIPIFVFNTDFMRTRIGRKRFDISPIITEITNVHIYEYLYDSEKSYYDELRDNINLFSSFVTKTMEKSCIQITPMFENEQSQDSPIVFVDICGCKYEWCKHLASEIGIFLDNHGIPYWTSNRYSDDYDYHDDFSVLHNSKIMITCYDENEPDIDSCVLQGYAYRMRKYIIGYETINMVYFVEGKQEMHVNFMLEQSCNYIARDLEALKIHIEELVQ